MVRADHVWVRRIERTVSNFLAPEGAGVIPDGHLLRRWDLQTLNPPKYTLPRLLEATEEHLWGIQVFHNVARLWHSSLELPTHPPCRDPQLNFSGDMIGLHLAETGGAWSLVGPAGKTRSTHHRRWC
jgi:hypothetical protein